MQINNLIKKQNALTLLSKIKKYEYEQDAYNHSLAIECEKAHEHRLAVIIQQLSDIDTYLAFNIFPSHQKAIDQYSTYIAEKQREELISVAETKNEIALLLDNILKNTKAKKIIGEKSLKCSKELATLIEFKHNQE
ncbi:hypothetical protein GCM10011613_32470 [Cellvibrio zantedeschiae]|uniref:Flagellar protein FlgN n=1 Tax=Cellvibrio zantedeschiae TaxID=1237077 RepID=A0ABQ3B8S3_9GAMM|nr:hypothetical protein [Cellvibrio zantedeschiae]GGY84906.1 hypothetical protein GCM10011613_32470 [Cellvibrio zantedeschiae]